MKGPSARPDPDPALVKRARDGNREALKTLLEEVSPMVGQWSLSYAGDPDEAADLTQEVLILLVRKLPAYRGDSKFLTWLYTVTRNQAIEAFRKTKRYQRKMSHYKATDHPEERVSSPQDRGVDRERIRDLVRTFLTELPERQREVFQMSELQGLSSPEIGEILGVDPGGVRAALFKARRALRLRILAQHPEFVEEFVK